MNYFLIIILLFNILKIFIFNEISNETRLYSCFDLVTKITKNTEKEKITIKIKTAMAFTCYCLATEKDIKIIMSNFKNEKISGFSLEDILNITNPELLNEKLSNEKIKKFEKEFLIAREKIAGKNAKKKDTSKEEEIKKKELLTKKIKELIFLILKIKIKQLLPYIIAFIIFIIFINILIYKIYKHYKKTNEKKNN